MEKRTMMVVGMVVAILTVGLAAPNVQATNTWWISTDPGLWSADDSGGSLAKNYATSDAYGLACAPDGFTYVARYNSGTVERYNTVTAALDSTWQVSGFTNPNFTKVGPDGKLYVEDDSNATIYQVDTAAKTKTAVLTLSGGASSFAFDGAGKVYVASYNNRYMYRYDTGSTWTYDGWTIQQNYAYGMAVTNDSVYVTNYWNTVYKYDIANRSLVWSSATGGQAHDLAIGADGKLYVAAGNLGVLRTDTTTPSWQTFVVLSPYGYPTGEVADSLSETPEPATLSLLVLGSLALLRLRKRG